LSEMAGERLKITTPNVEKLKAFFKKQQQIVELVRKESVEIPFKSDENSAILIKQLVNLEIDIYSVERTKNTLEDMFIKLISE